MFYNVEGQTTFKLINVTRGVKVAIKKMKSVSEIIIDLIYPNFFQHQHHFFFFAYIALQLFFCTAVKHQPKSIERSSKF